MTYSFTQEEMKEKEKRAKATADLAMRQAIDRLDRLPPDMRIHTSVKFSPFMGSWTIGVVCERPGKKEENQVTVDAGAAEDACSANAPSKAKLVLTYITDMIENTARNALLAGYSSCKSTVDSAIALLNKKKGLDISIMKLDLVVNDGCMLTVWNNYMVDGQPRRRTLPSMVFSKDDFLEGPIDDDKGLCMPENMPGEYRPVLRVAYVIWKAYKYERGEGDMSNATKKRLGLTNPVARRMLMQARQAMQAEDGSDDDD